MLLDLLNAIAITINITASYKLYKYTYGFESIPTYMSNKEASAIKQKNEKRLKGQKAGFRLLIIGFVIQFIAITALLIKDMN